MTTANKITILRMVMIPVFLILAYGGYSWWALAVYIIACLSDTLDGYIARHCHQVTNVGKFMDPLADKMLVLAAMVFFVEKGLMPGGAVAIVLLREFAVSGLRMIAVEQQRVIAAAWSGKIKTTVTMIGLGVILVFGEISVLRWIIVALILITTLYSGVEYFLKNKDVFRDAT